MVTDHVDIITDMAETQQQAFCLSKFVTHCPVISPLIN